MRRSFKPELRHYNWGFGSGVGDVVVYLGATVPVTLLAIGCLVAARQMATDRAVLTGPAGYRHTRFAGLFALVLSVSVLLTMAGWGDVVSLLTRG